MKKRDKNILCYVLSEGNRSPDGMEYCKTADNYYTLWAVYAVRKETYIIEFDYICKKINLYKDQYKEYRGIKVYNNLDYIEKYRYKAV